MKIEAICWDIDGTLVDSEPLHLAAMLSASQGHGVDLSDLPDDRFVGLHTKDTWNALKNRFPPEIGYSRWMDDIDRHYVAGCADLPIIPNAVGTIQKFAEIGVKQAAVSNSGRVVVNANLNRLGVEHLLEFSLSLDDVGCGKPNPEPYLTALSNLGVHPSNALAVEDSATGIASAHAAGMRVLSYGNPSAVATAEISCISQVLMFTNLTGEHS